MATATSARSIRTAHPWPRDRAGGTEQLYLTLGSLLVTLLLAVPVALYSLGPHPPRGAFSSPSTWSPRSGLLARLRRHLLFIHRFGSPALSASAARGASRWLYGCCRSSCWTSPTHREQVIRICGRARAVLTEDYIRTRARRARRCGAAFKEGFLLPMTEMIAARSPSSSGAPSSWTGVNWPGLGRWRGRRPRIATPGVMGIALVAAAFVRARACSAPCIYAASIRGRRRSSDVRRYRRRPARSRSAGALALAAAKLADQLAVGYACSSSAPSSSPNASGAAGWLPDDPARMTWRGSNAPPGGGHAARHGLPGPRHPLAALVGIQAYFLPGCSPSRSRSARRPLGRDGRYRGGRAEALVTI